MTIKSLSRITKNATPSFWWGIVGTSLPLTGLFLFGIALSTTQWALTSIISGTAYVIGILIGIFVSPHKGEGANFRVIGGYVATFISGFVVSKVTSLDVMGLITNNIGNPLRSGRFLLAISMFLLGVIQTYFVRVYIDKNRQQDELVRASG